MKEELTALYEWDRMTRGTKKYEFGRAERLQRVWEILAELSLAEKADGAAGQ